MLPDPPCPPPRPPPEEEKEDEAADPAASACATAGECASLAKDAMCRSALEMVETPVARCSARGVPPPRGAGCAAPPLLLLLLPLPLLLLAPVRWCGVVAAPPAAGTIR
jgi:hypothetical protein